MAVSVPGQGHWHWIGLSSSPSGPLRAGELRGVAGRRRCGLIRAFQVRRHIDRDASGTMLTSPERPAGAAERRA
jgi:hypothetical protein